MAATSPPIFERAADQHDESQKLGRARALERELQLL
jgi:hypothetical protein